MSSSIRLSVRLHLLGCLSVSVSSSIRLSVRLHLLGCLSVCVSSSIRLSVRLHLLGCLSVCVSSSIRLSVRLHLLGCLSVCVSSSIRLSVCLCVFIRLGLYRDAESQFKSALKHFSTVDMFLFLCKVYVKLDQPTTALEYYKKVRCTPSLISSVQDRQIDTGSIDSPVQEGEMYA